LVLRRGLYDTVDIYCITVVCLSETISLRLPRETAKKLREIADKEGKDRSTLIRELLEHGVKEKSLEQAVELYRTGQVTGWKAAQLAGVSLWTFYNMLEEKGVLIQYSERDLEEDLKS
jgi:predicted HTH domain antitoxin